MKTIVLEQPGHFVLTQTQPPTGPGPGEALIRIRKVGICGTDLHAFQGNQPFFEYPRILGHELSGEIVEVGPEAQGFAVGDHCAIEPYFNCGHCLACRRGKTNCCARLKVLGVHTDGGMRDFIVAPIHKLHKSELLPLEHLALVEPLCIGYHGVERAELEPGQFALVVGLGPIGLSVAQFAHLAGAKVIAMDVNSARLDFCQEVIGVAHCINAAQVEPIQQLLALTEGELPLTVFDVTGSLRAMEQSFSYVANGGKLVFVGLVKSNISFSDPEFHRREMTILSSRNATTANFKQVISALEGNKINLSLWITHQAPAETMIQAFPGWLKPESGVIKAVVEF
jgi:2-desacetyl-2-hydroxyethyl bacteriochlorophyllide A dehydrogenase